MTDPHHDDWDPTDDDAPDAPPPDDVDWEFRAGITRNSQGRIVKEYGNLESIVCEHPELRGMFRRNLLTNDIEVSRDRPVGMRDWIARDQRPVVTDLTSPSIRAWLSRRNLRDWAKGDIQDAISSSAQQHAYHPVREYLSTVKWDGTPRLDEWLSTVYGCQQTRLMAEQGRRWMISAVARVFEPGCKADYMLVLTGGEGLRKTTSLESLVPDKEWFDANIQIDGDKDSLMKAAQCWIGMVPELGSITNQRRGNEIVKAFLTASDDKYREPYGKTISPKKRQCVFVGDSNSDTPLPDDVGNRRYWIVRVSRMADVDWLRANRDQLWAEAVERYRAGEKWYLDAELEADARTAQDDARDRGHLEPEIERVLADRITPVTNSDVYGLMDEDLRPREYSKAASIAIGKALARCGWERKRGTCSGRRVWEYHPPPKIDPDPPSDTDRDPHADGIDHCFSDLLEPE